MRRAAFACACAICAAACSAGALSAQEPPVVAAGDARIAGDALRSGAWTARYNALTDSGPREMMKIDISLTAIDADGRAAWQLIHAFTGAAGAGADTSVFLREGLQPLRHGSSNPRRTMTLVFEPRLVTGEVRSANGKARTIDRAVDVAVFDGGTLDFVLAALPLAPGYAARIPVYIEENGGVTWVAARVVGMDDIETSTGIARAWKLAVEYPFGTGTLWIDPTERRPMRMEAAGPGGQRFRVEYAEAATIRTTGGERISSIPAQ